MIVYVKNKFFSLKGSSTVKDDAGRDVFAVKGKLVSPTKKKFICSLDGKTLYTVRNKFFHLFVHSVYVSDEHGEKIARVKHPPFSPKKFVVEGYKDEITVDGDFFSMKSTITRGGVPIGTITRAFDIVDAFKLEAEPEDIPFLIALIIGIDNITDKMTKS